MTTIGQDEAAQAMAERDPLPQEVTYHVWTADEPAAGLQGERAEVRMFVDAEDDAETRKMLNRTFSVFWGEQTRRVRVMREEPPERTPETVLRAMLRAYERALDLFAQEALRTGTEHLYAERDYTVSRLRFVLARMVVYGALPEETCDGARLLQDYQARLSGARAMNAPPLE